MGEDELMKTPDHLADNETTPPQQCAHESLESKELENWQLVGDSKESVSNPEKKLSDKDDELMKTANHLADAGLGDVEVLLELLKANHGSVKGALEALLNQA